MVDTATTGHLGWCRGLAVDDATIAVGLTAIRSAPHHAWRDDPFASTETSILELDVQTGRLLGRVEYAEAGRHAKVFSLIAPAAPS